VITDGVAQRDDLDPADWESFRSLAHGVVDDMVNYLRTVRERPVWQSPPATTREFFSTDVPRRARDLAAVYRDVKEHVLPYPTGNIHPRFWGWVMGNGTPVGVLADLIGATINCHVSGYDQAATLVERQVIRWLCTLMDYPEAASGILVSGGTAANLIGLTVARNTASAQRVRTDGVAGVGGRLAVYGSEATHGWLGRSCDLLGLGERAFRKVPTDSEDRVDVAAMARQIRTDREAGWEPICIVGTAGTVSTGATDDLAALADLARAEGVWFHVDGAFGALAKLSPRYRGMVDGLERADSIAFDLHKWGYMQYEVGVALVRRAAAQSDSFSLVQSYLEAFRGGIAVEPIEFASKGVQLSRGFRALKVWMNLSAYGTDHLGHLIERNIDQVQVLKARISREPELEQLGPAAMNVICFRYRVPGVADTALDKLNAELLVRLQESGIAVPSNARIGGRFALRVAHTNHRTTAEDFDLVADAILRLGRELSPGYV
jgi:aromatic-L-amino-acid/L-tryptophan decarboxylase